ncbi:MAG: hypothetical protein J0L80_15805 [Chitinophagales bacterium]|nr:hypothetical protein [Chitinophagales bacterium]
MKNYSNDAYEKGTEDFVAIDAWLDGYIQDNVPFEIVFDNGTFTINDSLLPKKDNDRYIQKIDSFLNKYGTSAPNRTFKVYSQGHKFQPEKSLGTELDCRYKISNGIMIDKSHGFVVPRNILSKDSLLVKALIQDIYIVKPTKVSIRCNVSKCWINGLETKPNHTAKYRELIQNSTGIIPKSDQEYVSKSITKQEIEYFIDRD